MLIYSRHYDIGFFGLERLHPFDSHKYGRAWRVLRRELGPRLKPVYLPVDRAVTDAELGLVHEPAYLASLRDSKVLAAALELPVLAPAPNWLLRWSVLRPMRWATRGTFLAARAALKHGLAINLSGGYHHAKPGQGEGFCIFSDVALAIRQLRAEGLLSASQRIACVDLDAHQGNGVCHQFMNDRSMFILDMYNRRIYPASDYEARDRIDCDIPLDPGCRGAEYLEKLKQQLPGFLDSTKPALGVYNAGTDVFVSDRLGALSLLEDDVRERDRFVIEQFRQRSIPVFMVPSGGYSSLSYRLIANTVLDVIKRGLLSAK